MKRFIMIPVLAVMLAGCADMVPATCTDARGDTFEGNALVNGDTVIEYRIKDGNGFEKTISEGISEYYNCRIMKKVGETVEIESTLPSEPEKD